MASPRLLLVHEPEAAARERLRAQGFGDEVCVEIASYLAQSTDLAPEFEAIERACAGYGIDFRPVELDRTADELRGLDPARTLVWTLTDGIAYYRGGAGPMLARLAGLPVFGSGDDLFALCQDKFRSGAVLRALGLPVPDAGLARGGDWLVEPPPSARGWFVKPNRLGAKIGIWPDSHCRDLGHSLALARRIQERYRDDAIVQAYVPGRNVRASFLAVEADAEAGAAGLAVVDEGTDFLTMAGSLALFGETGALARAAEPVFSDLATAQPGATAAIRSMIDRMTRALGLRDVFSLDLRVEGDDTAHLIEFEVCPGLPCFDFRAYCRTSWGLELPEAMAAAAAARLGVQAMAEPLTATA